MINFDEKFELNMSKSKSIFYNDLTQTCVTVNDDLLYYLCDEFENRNDEYWCDGKGKEYYFKIIEKDLIKSNKYFNKHKREVKSRSDRFLNFCNLNAVYVVLRYVLRGDPVPLVHPSEWTDLSRKFGVDDRYKPDLNSDIPVWD